MTGEPNECFAATGLWPVHADAANATIPDHILADPDLSLIAKLLFALLVAEQEKPVNPFEDTLESAEAIAEAVSDLLNAGLALRVSK